MDESEEIIGRIGLFGLKKGRLEQDPALGSSRQEKSEPQGTELGIVIGERSAWDKGYGRESVRILADLAFEQLRLETLVLYTLPENLRAQRSFEAVGFQNLGAVRRFNLELGAHDEMAMVMHTADHKHQQAQPSPEQPDEQRSEKPRSDESNRAADRA